MNVDGCHQKLRSWRPAIFFFLLAIPATAHAHAALRGMGEFGGGFIHPLLTLPHVLILLGLGLWVGQHPPLRLKLPLLVFLPFSAAGLLLTTKFPMPAAWQPVLICVALCAGILVALSMRLPVWASAPLFATAAIAIGLDSGVDSAFSAGSIAKTLFATWISLNLWIVNFSFYTALCPQRKWVQIGIRIAGSWIAAISMMVLAFALKAKALA